MENINLTHFNKLLEFTHDNSNSQAIYTFIYSNGDKVKAEYDTDYESDNGLDEDEVGYEEYQCIIFCNIDDHTLIDINYHNLPDHILINNSIIF